VWAQLIKTRIKPGKEGNIPRLAEQLRDTEQPESGLLRSAIFLDQKEPSQLYFLVVFESEEKARLREQDERRNEGLAAVRALMAETFDGTPEFVDLIVAEEWSPTT
jgi:quinol monooxygenase YgiN